MPRSFLVKKAKHPVDHHFGKWNYKEPSSPCEGETAPSPFTSLIICSNGSGKKQHFFLYFILISLRVSKRPLDEVTG